MHLSGNMKVFWDGCPVSSRSGVSSSGAAPEVDPESRKANLLDFLFCSFCAQCTTTLLDGIPLAIANMAISTLVVLPDDDSSCSSTRQASGNQLFEVCSLVLFVTMFAATSESTVDVPGACQAMA